MASSPLSKDSSISIVPSSWRLADPSPEISSPSSEPVQRKNTIVRPYSSSAVASMHRRRTRPIHCQRSRERPAGEIEISTIPQVGFDNPPAADQLAFYWVAHVDVASSLGARTRL